MRQGASQFLLVGRAGRMFTDLWLLGTIQMRLNVTRVASRVTSPTLVTGYEQDQFYPGQGSQVYALLRSPKAYHYFTSAHGTEYHDAPMAPQTRNQVVFDWLDGVLTSRRRCRGRSCARRGSPYMISDRNPLIGPCANTAQNRPTRRLLIETTVAL